MAGEQRPHLLERWSSIPGVPARRVATGRGELARRRYMTGVLGSLRARVFLLVVLVAAAATGATAWLTLRDATTQLTESASVQSETIETIRGRLLRYATAQGTWEGVPGTVEDLRERTGQRILLTTSSGAEVVVDTDHLAGRLSRPHPSEPSTLIDPLPDLNLTGVREADLRDTTLTAIVRHRVSTRAAACLTRRGFPLNAVPAKLGLTTSTIDLGLALDKRATGNLDSGLNFDEEEKACQGWAGEIRGETGDEQAVDACMQGPAARRPLGGDTRACLAEAFRTRASLTGPVPLLLYLGAVGAPRSSVPDLSPSRALIAAALVAALAVLVTIVLTHRVLSPIARLTGASRRLGEGDLSERVPVRGHDELAELATAFNRMADSLHRGKQQQRRMIGDISHELRTPLANLRGYLEALKDGVVEPSPELFASLHEEAVLQQRLVDDLHELALAEAGALVNHRVAVDVAELLETCRTAHLAAAESAGVDLRVQAGRLPQVNADPDRLRQAIGNLVTNALRATPSGGVVTIRGDADPDGERVRISVEDTGHGIAAEDLDRVFDRLWRADASRTRGTGGSGLGLAIAREIVTAHGGTITATSTPGKLTAFTITLRSSA
jgi:two-component system sensor histidine kinase BaeS